MIFARYHPGEKVRCVENFNLFFGNKIKMCNLSLWNCENNTFSLLDTFRWVVFQHLKNYPTFSLNFVFCLLDLAVIQMKKFCYVKMIHPLPKNLKTCILLHAQVDLNLVDEFTADCLVIWITIIQKIDSKPKNRRLNIHKEHNLLQAIVKYSQISMWKIEKHTCKSKQNLLHILF